MSLNLDKSDWKRVSFGDVAAASKESCDPTDGTVDRFIAGEHMDTDDLKIRRWGVVGDGYLGPAFHRRFHPGQVLYGSRRTYLRKVAVAEFDGVCANTTFAIETLDESVLAQSFLPFVMSSEPFHAFAIAESRGSVNPYVNWSDIARYEFDLPHLDTQQRLAETLWNVEGLTDGSKRYVGALSSISEMLFASLTHGMKHVALSEWLQRIDAGTSPKAVPEPCSENEYGVLKVSAVGENSFRSEENKRLLSDSDFRQDSVVGSGDLLVTRANALVANVARCCLVDRDYPNLMLSDKTLRLVPKKEFPARVVLAALRAEKYRAHVRESVGGTDAKNISQRHLRAGPVPDLKPDDAVRLSAKLACLDCALEAARSELQQVMMLRTVLLLDIFAGSR